MNSAGENVHAVGEGHFVSDFGHALAEHGEHSKHRQHPSAARALTQAISGRTPPAMPTPSALVISENYAGLRAQALGLATAAGLQPLTLTLQPAAPWRWLPARLWPGPIARRTLRTWPSPAPELLVGCGGVVAAVASAQRRPLRTVHVQHPRMRPDKFDLVVVNRHDDLTGPNVLVSRTALHLVTPQRLAEAAAIWAPRLAHLPRPLAVLLVGGSNGRFTLDEEVATRLANQLAVMTRNDRVGLAITPSRRTHPSVTRTLAETLQPFGAWVWDGTGENPYYGLLALADAIIVTMDSVSMVSEAVATRAPVMLAPLPGKSRRIRAFLDGLFAAGRIRLYTGRCEIWPTQPLDDTAEIGHEVRRRLGY